MLESLIIVVAVISLVNLFLLIRKGKNQEQVGQFDTLHDAMRRFETLQERFEKDVKEEFRNNRSELADQGFKNREEMTKALNEFGEKSRENTKELNELLRQKFTDFSTNLDKHQKDGADRIKEIKTDVEKQLVSIREDNTKQLDEMRKTVDEKLQKTLNERLSQSFETVGKQLQAVQEGLGEMKTLASDVGGLKKVLSNVKMRGGIGEIQLSLLLEQILAPEQYEANVKTKRSGSEIVEFAIKLPGREDSNEHVWLPIDAKFPKDIYEQLTEAYEVGEPDKVQAAQKVLDNTIKKMAKDINEKYVEPPYTTDFAIMFLPFEGIYAEVVRKAALLEELQRKYKVIVTGPTTLAAILNSLQIGFKTLAIQKRSSEVWEVLGAVKTEFGKFGDMMEKAQKNIQTGLNQLDDVMGVRTRAIQRKLKNIEALGEGDTQEVLKGLPESLDFDDEE